MRLEAPALKNPPGDDEIKEEVDDPQGVNPVEANATSGLEHLANAEKNARHAERTDR